MGFRLAISAGVIAMPLVIIGQLDLFGSSEANESSVQPLAVAATTSTTSPDQITTTTTEPPSSSSSESPSTTAAPPEPGSTTTGPPPTAAPTTDEPSPGTTSKLDYEHRGEAALAQISYPWRTKLPGWTIEFKPSRSGVLGYTYTNEKRIEVYVRDSMTEKLLVHVIAHELGHAVDVTLNDGNERRAWLRLRGFPDTDWWPAEGGVSDFHSGAGDFAEGFAAWQVGTSSYRSKLAPAPNSEQLELIAELANN